LIIEVAVGTALLLDTVKPLTELGVF